MSLSEQYIQTVRMLGTFVLGVITVWAVRAGRQPPVIVLLGLATLFFLGLAVPVISNRVPRYHRISLVGIGFVAVGILLLGYRFELAIAMAVLGGASGLDLVRKRLQPSA